MWVKFDDNSRRAILRAEVEAHATRSCFDLECLLVGLLQDEAYTGDLLRGTGLRLKNVRAWRRAQERSEPQFQGEPKLTEDAKRALELSAEEARLTGCDFIGSEHLLLGILRFEEAAPTSLLHQRGLTLESVRAFVVPPLFDKPELETEEGSAPTHEQKSELEELRRPSDEKRLIFAADRRFGALCFAFPNACVVAGCAVMSGRFVPHTILSREVLGIRHLDTLIGAWCLLTWSVGALLACGPLFSRSARAKTGVMAYFVGMIVSVTLAALLLSFLK